eukprot:2491598-Lingulodinium_polyedra.AAC.1
MEEASVQRELVAPTHSDNLSKSIGKDAGVVQDKRLCVVISMLRQAVAPEEGTTVLRVPATMMAADPFAKNMDPTIIVASTTAVKYAVPAKKPRATSSAAAHL